MVVVYRGTEVVPRGEIAVKSQEPAKGEPVWEFATTPGVVLYLCLEDSLTRIQSRLFQITEDAPPTLHFATLAGSIGAGMKSNIQELQHYAGEHNDDLRKACIDRTSGYLTTE